MSKKSLLDYKNITLKLIGLQMFHNDIIANLLIGGICMLHNLTGDHKKFTCLSSMTGR